jgi:hypothetical protein
MIVAFRSANRRASGPFFCRGSILKVRNTIRSQIPAMDVSPPRSTPWSKLAGGRAARGLMNQGFQLGATLRRRQLSRTKPAQIQEKLLARLVHKARQTRFGRDHHFDTIRSVADFQRRVPLRTYEVLWDEYLRDCYPIFEDLTWPGRIPFIALSSGTTRGQTKYIPVSAEMIASNRKAALTMLAYHAGARPGSRLFRGRLFFLGGSTKLDEPARGVLQGDLSGIAAWGISPLLRPCTFPPLHLALESDWDEKLTQLAVAGCRERITLVGGVPSWLLLFFERVFKEAGKSTLFDVWPDLEVVVHGGVRFDPYRESFQSILGSPAIRLQETYPSSEGFIAFGDPATGSLRLVHDHGIFYEFIPVEQLDSPSPVRDWLGTARTGVNYAIVVSTCAGLWAHVIGDTIRLESLDPPLLTITGRTAYTLSAFGEHLINEEVELAIAQAALATRSRLREWHVGPRFTGRVGHHQLVVEFQNEPAEAVLFRDLLDSELIRRNADYRAHRSLGAGLPAPSLIVARPGSFEAWMRRRGKLGGQHKVPRMDNSGTLTLELMEFLRETGRVAIEVDPRGETALVSEARRVSDSAP